MKSNLKENWTPQWLKDKPEGWQRPQPTRTRETNHVRVVRQREAHRQYLEAVKKS